MQAISASLAIRQSRHVPFSPSWRLCRFRCGEELASKLNISPLTDRIKQVSMNRPAGDVARF